MIRVLTHVNVENRSGSPAGRFFGKWSPKARFLDCHQLYSDPPQGLETRGLVSGSEERILLRVVNPLITQAKRDEYVIPWGEGAP